MKIQNVISVVVVLLIATTVKAQPAVVQSSLHRDLTVLYDISIHSRRKNAGIEETYNGGIKTIMVKNDRARVRLVSLMRVQSHYFFKHDSGLSKVLITKESGKKKYKYLLTAEDWKSYNKKYENITCTLLEDTKLIAGYRCRKAIVTVPGQDKEVTVYYTPELKPLDKHIEPLFAQIPGMVLQYVTESEAGSVTFTANKIVFEPLDESLLSEPSAGYIQKSYEDPER